MLKLSQYHFETLPDFTIDRVKCATIVNSANSIDDIYLYINRIIGQLKLNNVNSVSEALRVAIPIIYRLALDDTSNGIRIAAEIKELCCKLLFPNFFSAISNETSLLFFDNANFTAADAEQLLDKTIGNLYSTFNETQHDFKVYGRIKKPYSIFNKLFRYWDGEKKPKNRLRPITESLSRVLHKFEANVLYRMDNCIENQKNYKNEEIKWIVPDYFAITIQFDSSIVKNTNFGTTKAKYKSLYKILKSKLNFDTYYGPTHSDKWHMKRLVFYALIRVDDFIAVPCEIFIRTDYDYFFGYANYWRYKNIELLEKQDSLNDESHIELMNEIKRCKNFREVQELIFKDITTGQLLMF